MCCFRKKVCIALAALLVVIAAGSASLSVFATTGGTAELREMNAAQVSRMLRRKDVAIIDNRQAELFEAGHIPGALHMVYHKPGSAQNRMTAEMLAPFRDKTLIFYCSGGNRACYGAGKALEWGISSEVFWFKGGWPEWQEHLQTDTDQTF